MFLATSTPGIPQISPPWERVALPREDVEAPKSSISANRIGPVGDSGLWVTSLNGKSWIKHEGQETWVKEAYPRGVSVEGGLVFIDANHAWAAGAVKNKAPWLASTSDGGETWHPQPAPPGSGRGGFSDVQFFDKDLGIAVGSGDLADGQPTLVAVTHDGGASWNPQMFKLDGLVSALSRVRFESRSVVWAVGGLSIYVSRDSGISWRIAHREESAVQLNGIAIENSHIFVTGGYGLILHSRDSGSTWEKLKVPAAIRDRYLNAVCFVDALHGWVGGDHGTIIATQNGGVTWQKEESGVDGLIRDLEAINGNIYAAGDGFFVLKRPTAAHR